ncbi:MAG: ATP-binding protein, partial [Chitinophagales bacterium]
MEPANIVQLLKETEIFRDIPVTVLQDSVSYMQLLHFEAGEPIVRKNETGNCMFVIVKGKVRVHDNDYAIAHMERGDFFGEMSLLDSSPRSMSVSASEKVEVIGISQEIFYTFLKHHPALIKSIMAGVNKRLRTQNQLLIEEFKSREQELKRQVEKQTLLYREQKERAEQSEKFKQQFLANMSHEIRTPMNAVSGITSLLLAKKPRPDQHHYLEAISKSSDTLLHIINDILDISKIEAGKIEIEKIDFSLKELLEQVKQTLDFKAEEKGLLLITRIGKGVPDVLIGDPVRLNQVMINLGGNAIKFTEKGSITIEVESKEANLTDETAGGFHDFLLTFHITDTGIGIPEKKLDSIFESFTQVYSSDSRRFGGSGLGLSISRQLVELQGGKISVASEEGCGTTFSFTITCPAGSAERLSHRIQQEQKADGSILNGLKILLAEDDEYNRVVAVDTLKLKAAIEIDVALNGEEVIALL